MTNESESNESFDTLREQGTHYVVDTQGHPVAALLTLQEYSHYPDLLEDEADSQDEELAKRLEQALAPSPGEVRQSFRD
jgi:PHD/YefM family antitoxin component YafN of YafNO toxin-antitoxin module